MLNYSVAELRFTNLYRDEKCMGASIQRMDTIQHYRM